MNTPTEIKDLSLDQIIENMRTHDDAKSFIRDLIHQENPVFIAFCDQKYLGENLRFVKELGQISRDTALTNFLAAYLKAHISKQEKPVFEDLHTVKNYLDTFSSEKLDKLFKQFFKDEAPDLINLTGEGKYLNGKIFACLFENDDKTLKVALMHHALEQIEQLLSTNIPGLLFVESEQQSRSQQESYRQQQELEQQQAVRLTKSKSTLFSNQIHQQPSQPVEGSHCCCTIF